MKCRDILLLLLLLTAAAAAAAESTTRITLIIKSVNLFEDFLVLFT